MNNDTNRYTNSSTNNTMNSSADDEANSFDKLAKMWDSNPKVVTTNDKFVDSLEDYFKQDFKDAEVLDYGCGTGLVSIALAKRVLNIVGLDSSAKMVDAYNTKALEGNIENIFAYKHDITKDPLNYKFDLIVTNMTMHHIEDYEKFILTLLKNLRPDGKIAISDLEIEDGTFHSDNTDVKHFGFKKEKIENIFKRMGMMDVEIKTIDTIKKNNKEYNVFAIFGTRF